MGPKGEAVTGIRGPLHAAEWGLDDVATTVAEKWMIHGVAASGLERIGSSAN